MRLGWYKELSTGQVYFLDTLENSGNAVIDVQNIDGFYYYFSKQGCLQTDLEIGNGVALDEQGRVTVNGVLQVSGETTQVSTQKNTFKTAEKKFSTPRTSFAKAASSETEAQTVAETVVQSEPEIELPNPESYQLPMLNFPATARDGNPNNTKKIVDLLQSFGTEVTEVNMYFEVNKQVCQGQYKNWATFSNSSSDCICSIGVINSGTEKALVFATNAQKFILPEQGEAPTGIGLSVGDREVNFFNYIAPAPLDREATIPLLNIDCNHLSLYPGSTSINFMFDNAYIKSIRNFDTFDLSEIQYFTHVFRKTKIEEMPIEIKDQYDSFTECFSSCVNLRTVTIKVSDENTLRTMANNFASSIFNGCTSLTTINTTELFYNRAKDYFIGSDTDKPWANATVTDGENGLKVYTKANGREESPLHLAKMNEEKDANVQESKDNEEPLLEIATDSEINDLGENENLESVDSSETEYEESLEYEENSLEDDNEDFEENPSETISEDNEESLEEASTELEEVEDSAETEISEEEKNEERETEESSMSEEISDEDSDEEETEMENSEENPQELGKDETEENEEQAQSLNKSIKPKKFKIDFSELIKALFHKK